MYNNNSFIELFVVPPGFEPGLKDPKSCVLPLHHGTIPNWNN